MRRSPSANEKEQDAPLGLGELHLVHALAGVPVQEGAAAEHARELRVDALEERLDRGRVADERDGLRKEDGAKVSVRGSKEGEQQKKKRGGRGERGRREGAGRQEGRRRRRRAADSGLEDEREGRTILRPLGGISQCAVWTLFGIHSTKWSAFFCWTASIVSSTSRSETLPRQSAATVR